MKAFENAGNYQIPAIAGANSIPNFNPMMLVKQTQNGPILDLKYKKLIFRLKYPQGRIKLSPLKVTDQLAIIEASIFLDRNDTEAISNHTSSSDIKSAPDGQYLKHAQDLATDQALNDAGFGLQLVGIGANDKTEKTQIAPKPAPRPIEQPEITVVPAPKAKAEQIVRKESVAQPPVSINEADFEEIVIDMPEAPVAPIVETVFTASVPQPEQPVHTEPVTKQPAVAPAPPTPTIVTEVIQKSTAPAYTKSMSVEEICAVMSLEDAENYVVTSGTCTGMTIAQVAERRSASLKFYMNGYSGDDNILRAAAKIVSDSRLAQQAS